MGKVCRFGWDVLDMRGWREGTGVARYSGCGWI